MDIVHGTWKICNLMEVFIHRRNNICIQNTVLDSAIFQGPISRLIPLPNKYCAYKEGYLSWRITDISKSSLNFADFLLMSLNSDYKGDNPVHLLNVITKLRRNPVKLLIAVRCKGSYVPYKKAHYRKTNVSQLKIIFRVI